MLERRTRVLFVSQKNSARGLMAESCLRLLGGRLFEISSCGVSGMIAHKPDTTALAVLATMGFKIDGLHPKDWLNFSRQGSRPFDIVIGLDSDTKNRHPSWPGQPETALWHYPSLDRKKNETNGDRDIRVVHTLHSMRRRIELLVSLRERVRTHAELRHDIRDMNHL